MTFSDDLIAHMLIGVRYTISTLQHMGHDITEEQDMEVHATFVHGLLHDLPNPQSMEETIEFCKEVVQAGREEMAKS